MNGATLMAVLLTGLAQAADQDQGGSAIDYCLPPGTVVHYANGMDNTWATAMASLQALQFEVKSDLVSRTPDIPLYFELRYNQKEDWSGISSVFQAAGIVDELPEVIAQYTEQEIRDYWRRRAGAPRTTVTDALKDAFVLAFQSWMSPATNAVEFFGDADLNAMVGRYKQLHVEGNAQLVVAHSQGTMYSNQAYERAGITDESMQMYFAGSPANEVFGGGLHSENTDDWVGYLGLLDATNENVDKSGDPRQHNFVKAYLRGDRTGQEVKSKILESFDALDDPSIDRQGSPGEFVVTLTWPTSSSSDVDLHVEEPTGHHEYFGVIMVDDRDNIGTLDVDALGKEPTGWTEHYVIDCGDLEDGTYKIGLNYYSGEESVLATVHVAVRDKSDTYTKVFTEDNPTTAPVATWIANVTVHRSSDGDLAVSFQEL